MKLLIFIAILAVVLARQKQEGTPRTKPQQKSQPVNETVETPFEALLNIENLKREAFDFYEKYRTHEHIVPLTVTIVILLLSITRIPGVFRSIRHNGIIQPSKEFVFKRIRKIPFVKRKIQAELDKTLKTLEEEVNKMRTEKIHKIPTVGIKAKKIMEKMDKWNTRDAEFRNNKHVTGCMYAREDDEAIELIKEYTKNYLYANPIHFEIFPSAMQMEAEVISMTAGLYNGTKDTCGILTNGGTESILLACLAYREHARERGIKNPEMVIPETAHAAFYKAGWYFGIKVIKVPYDQKTGQVYVNKLKSAVNHNTCMVAVSFPNYCNGNYDDVEPIAQFCHKKRIPLHVDCCLGGFLAPFAEHCQVKIPQFDFRLPGVTSISCDHHKYGLAPKGVSVVLFKNKGYRSHCMYALTSWPGGIYATPGISGSRSGVASAGAWIAMCYFGYTGFKERADAIFKTQQKFMDEIKTIPEIRLIGEPKLGTVAITSNVPGLNIYSVHDLMLKKGWHLNATQKPSAMQFLFNYCNIQFVDSLLKDIKECVAKCLSDPSLNGENKWSSLYATAAKLPTSLVEEGSKIALESFLKI